MDAPVAVTALSALAQQHRLAIFRRLVEIGPEGAWAGEIGEHLGLAANTLSFHLRTLQQAGLVVPEPQGRNIRYRADFAAMQSLVDYLTENCCAGADCASTRAAACC
ncbi:ArsR/SmtB family transcription factor [Arenimonas sp. MALMAid1274]|uniref:ArsR/SmtB family transcription factor n=1 Tax=Arenimonas sp. MALMAid1274 TaxID=3411630 RepID=UPI003B9E14E0